METFRTAFCDGSEDRTREAVVRRRLDREHGVRVDSAWYWSGDYERGSDESSPPASAAG